MLDANLKTQLKAYLERVKLPFEITASLDDSAAAGRRCMRAARRTSSALC